MEKLEWTVHLSLGFVFLAELVFEHFVVFNFWVVLASHVLIFVYVYLIILDDKKKKKTKRGSSDSSLKRLDINNKKRRKSIKHLVFLHLLVS